MQAPQVGIIAAFFLMSTLVWGQGSTSRLMCSAQAGSDLGAKIQACYNALPSNGGVCDCTDASLQGAQSSASSITCNKSNAVVLLGATGLTLNGGPWALNANGCAIIGSGRYQSWILTNSATADAVQSVAEKQVIKHVSIATAPGNTRTAGAGINVGVGAQTFTGPGDGLRIDDVTVFRTWHGIWGSGGSASGFWSNITCFPNEVPGYVGGGNPFNLGTGANDCIQLGPISGSDITGTSVDGVIADDNYNDAAIVVDGGTDSESFSNLDLGAPSSGSMTGIHVKNSTGSGFGGTSISFVGGEVAGAGSGSAIVVDACGSCTISNLSIGGGTNNVVIWTGVYQLNLNNNNIGFAQNQCINFAAGFNASIRITGNTIGSCSLSANNGFPSIGIGQGVTGVVISNNHFFPSGLCGIGGCANKASNNIFMGGGVTQWPETDFVDISGNIFGDKNGNAILNASPGTNIVITGNVGP